MFKKTLHFYSCDISHDVPDKIMHYSTLALSKFSIDKSQTSLKCQFLWFLWEFTFAEQFLQGVPGQGATDLEPLRNNSRCDEFVVGNFFVQLVVGSLVEEHQVVELVPHFSLGPLLLRVKEGAVSDVTIVSQSTTNSGRVSVNTCLLLGFASRLVDWVLVLLGLPSVLLLILFGRL